MPTIDRVTGGLGAPPTHRSIRHRALSIRSLRAIIHHQFGNTLDQSTLASMILSAKSSGRVNMTSWLPSISSSLNSPRRDDIRG
jgi:hypothetical protein